MSDEFNFDYNGETFEVNGQEMTGEQLLESYQKLQKEFTKVTQKNSEISKNEQAVKQWLDYDKSLQELSEQTGVDVKALAGSQINAIIENIAQGKMPTNAQSQQLDKAINKAEKAGDSETARQLEELQSYVSQQVLDKTIEEIFTNFAQEGYEIDADDFEKFTDEWLEDFGIGEDDEFDPKLLKKAAQAYEAKLLKESSRRRIPQLGTSGGTSSPIREEKKETVGGIKGASAKAAEYLNQFFR